MLKHVLSLAVGLAEPGQANSSYIGVEDVLKQSEAYTIETAGFSTRERSARAIANLLSSVDERASYQCVRVDTQPR